MHSCHTRINKTVQICTELFFNGVDPGGDMSISTCSPHIVSYSAYVYIVDTVSVSVFY